MGELRKIGARSKKEITKILKNIREVVCWLNENNEMGYNKCMGNASGESKMQKRIQSCTPASGENRKLTLERKMTTIRARKGKEGEENMEVRTTS
jgi:hypothetical protein